MEELPLEQKSILCSRSFKKPLSSFEELAEKISSFISLGAEKLRNERKFVRYVSVFIRTSPFLKEIYSSCATETLIYATDYTPLLIQAAKGALLKIFKKDLLYKKAGILFTNLEKKDPQLDFLKKDEVKKKRAMKIFDDINKLYDKKAIFFAAEGIESKSYTKRSSSKYTTSWDELLKAN